MHTKTIELYNFSELDDAAKETARQWYRESGLDFEWWDCVYEDATQCAKILGINIDKIYFSGFWSQGDGACFEGQYYYAKGAVKAIQQHAPQDETLHQIAQRLQEIQRPTFYQLAAYVTHSGRNSYYHEMSTNFDVRRDDAWPTDEQETAITEALRDFMRWIYRQLEKEYEYLSSDETVDDNIEANEYEFYQDGSRA